MIRKEKKRKIFWSWIQKDAMICKILYFIHLINENEKKSQAN